MTAIPGVIMAGAGQRRLCRAVMSPSGTTERGIATLDVAEAKGAILAALTASARRSRELALHLERGCTVG